MVILRHRFMRIFIEKKTQWTCHPPHSCTMVFIYPGFIGAAFTKSWITVHSLRFTETTVEKTTSDINYCASRKNNDANDLRLRNLAFGLTLILITNTRVSKIKFIATCVTDLTKRFLLSGLGVHLTRGNGLNFYTHH